VDELTFTIMTVFASVALLSGATAATVLGRRAPGRRRVVEMLAPAPHGVVEDGPILADAPSAALKRLATYVPKSPKEMSRLQKRLATAGFHGFTPVVVYAVSEIAFAVLGAASALLLAGVRRGFIFAVVGAVIGYMIPGLMVSRKMRLRKKQIQNGLPDALDMLIVGLEAGLALDQAILKCAEELEIAYPALAHELRMINIETRAGKPRMEAFKNFVKRSQVDDVRALVAMLVQTDRFGTSVAQALRTFAEVSRTKRRQRAEERAAKLAVKLIFPLVFFLLPAFFVVAVGPAIIKFVQFFGNMKLQGVGQ
jgi:tight adherence protein C